MRALMFQIGLNVLAIYSRCSKQGIIVFFYKCIRAIVYNDIGC